MSSFDLKLLCHTNDGTIDVLIEGRWYHYWGDNAKLLELLRPWQGSKPFNKRRWLLQLEAVCGKNYILIPTTKGD